MKNLSCDTAKKQSPYSTSKPEKKSSRYLIRNGAEYDKFDKLKDSGTGAMFWMPDGKFVYAYDTYGLFLNDRTISFWRVEN